MYVAILYIGFGNVCENLGNDPERKLFDVHRTRVKDWLVVGG